jgi:hypothetical protein
METIKCLNGETYYLSDEVYRATAHDHPSLREGQKVQLISGVDNSKTPGHHFSTGYKTVCRAGAAKAEFLGLKDDELKLVEQAL